VTVRRKITTNALNRAHTELNAAVERLNAPPECRMSWEFTDEVQPPGRSLELIRSCNSCPVFAECNALASLLPAHDKAHSVIAGVRYNGAGRPVDLHKAAAQSELNRSLAALDGAA
jgi:hypothetical protein